MTANFPRTTYSLDVLHDRGDAGVHEQSVESKVAADAAAITDGVTAGSAPAMARIWQVATSTK